MSYDMRNKSMNLRRLALPLTIALLFATTHSARLPNHALPTLPIVSFTSESSRPGNLSSLESHPGNEMPPSVNFIGVECYSLDRQRDIVTRQTCQPLFDNLVSRGRVYEARSWYNNFLLRYRDYDCTIKIYSPLREDRHSKIFLSMAQIILYATEVLDSCRESGTGGVNVIQGDWRVAVSKDVLRDTLAPPNL